MDYYLTLKKKEILTHLDMNLDIMLSEISQIQKDRYYMTLLI